MNWKASLGSASKRKRVQRLLLLEIMDDNKLRKNQKRGNMRSLIKWRDTKGIYSLIRELTIGNTEAYRGGYDEDAAGDVARGFKVRWPNIFPCSEVE